MKPWDSLLTYQSDRDVFRRARSAGLTNVVTGWHGNAPIPGDPSASKTVVPVLMISAELTPADTSRSQYQYRRWRFLGLKESPCTKRFLSAPTQYLASRSKALHEMWVDSLTVRKRGTTVDCRSWETCIVEVITDADRKQYSTGDSTRIGTTAQISWFPNLPRT